MSSRAVRGAFIITVLGLTLLVTLMYIFIKTVSYSTYMVLEQQFRRQRRRLESGKEGEEAVAHELKFLPREYKVLHGVVVTAPEREPQEIDHLVIGPAGVFHLETKNDMGRIIVTGEGDWIIKRDRHKVMGMKNPLAQIRRHEVVLAEFLGKAFPGRHIPLHGVVVLARPETIVEGARNCPVPIIKLDRLHDFLIGFDPVLSPTEVELLYFKLSLLAENGEVG